VNRFALHRCRFHLANVPGEVLLQGLLSADSLELLQQLPLLVKQHGGCAGDIRVAGGFAGIEHVDLRVMPIRLSDLAKHRSGHFAGGTVLAAEVQDYRAPGFQGFAVDRGQRFASDFRAH
jgi:hypothetical protein